MLEKVKFSLLQILDLQGNEIKDIKILEKSNFSQLKRLFIGDEYGYYYHYDNPFCRANSNNVSNINVFEKVNFKNLEILNLVKTKFQI